MSGNFALYNALRLSGIMTDQQAQDVVNAMEKDMSQHLASKEDLLKLDREITTIKTSIAELETRLTVRMGAMWIASVSVLAAIKFFA